MSMFRLEAFYMKAPAVIAAGSIEHYILMKPEHDPIVFEPPASAFVSKLMALLVEPIRGSHLHATFQSMEENYAYILASLMKQRIVITGTEKEIAAVQAALQPPLLPQICNRLVIGIGGSIEASLVFTYIDQLYFRFCHNLDIILTENALNFVNQQAFEYLYGSQVWIDPFKVQGNINVPHIHLAQSADLLIVIPATAHCIHRLTTGECSDLLSLVIAATSAPVVLVPTMNRAMWFHPSIQRNIAQLREDGFYIVEPGPGYEVSARHQASYQLGGPGVDPKGFVALLKAVLRRESNHEPSAGK